MHVIAVCGGWNAPDPFVERIGVFEDSVGDFIHRGVDDQTFFAHVSSFLRCVPITSAYGYYRAGMSGIVACSIGEMPEIAF